MSDSYKSTQRRLAFEKSRSKPEDILAHSFASGFIVAFLGFIAKLKALFGKHRKEVHHTHARGYGDPQGFGNPTPFISDPPVIFHKKNDGSVRRHNQLLRKYIARGYGYEAPSNIVEVIPSKRIGRRVKAKAKA
jgi:hypothetical protein